MSYISDRKCFKRPGSGLLAGLDLAVRGKDIVLVVVCTHVRTYGHMELGVGTEHLPRLVLLLLIFLLLSQWIRGAKNDKSSVLAHSFFPSLYYTIAIRT